MEERLQKILSRAGYGSRRACEQLIVKGEVTVNGQIATLGMKADAQTDKIKVSDRLIEVGEQHVYLAVHKPRNVISAASPQDSRKAVRDLVEEPGHLYPVGRLDVDSEGLILLTNDGELTNRLTHPKFQHEKEYKVLVATRPDDKQLAAWSRGIVLEDGYKTKPAQVRVTGAFGKGTWLQVILTEGRKRQIREMGRLTGLPVMRIIRVRISSLRLGNLKPRQWRHLTPEEVAELKGEASPGAARPPRPRRSSDTRRSPDGRHRSGSGRRPGTQRSTDSGRSSNKGRRPGSGGRPPRGGKRPPRKP